MCNLTEDTYLEVDRLMIWGGELWKAREPGWSWNLERAAKLTNAMILDWERGVSPARGYFILLPDGSYFHAWQDWQLLMSRVSTSGGEVLREDALAVTMMRHLAGQLSSDQLASCYQASGCPKFQFKLCLDGGDMLFPDTAGLDAISAAVAGGGGSRIRFDHSAEGVIGYSFFGDESALKLTLYKGGSFALELSALGPKTGGDHRRSAASSGAASDVLRKLAS